MILQKPSGESMRIAKQIFESILWLSREERLLVKYVQESPRRSHFGLAKLGSKLEVPQPQLPSGWPKQTV